MKQIIENFFEKNDGRNKLILNIRMENYGQFSQLYYTLDFHFKSPLFLYDISTRQMSRRIPSFSDLNIRSEQPIKRFKTAEASLGSSSYRNIFEQFNDVLPSPMVREKKEKLKSKPVIPKLSSQQSSTSSSTARSIMAKKLIKQDDELWSVLFQPKKRDDLIMHPRKIKDLEEILQRSCGNVTANKVNLI